MAASGIMAARLDPSPVYSAKGPSWRNMLPMAAGMPLLYRPTVSQETRLRTTSKGCSATVLVAPAKAADRSVDPAFLPILFPSQP